MVNNTILVAESCPDNMCLITAPLRDSGMRVIIATDEDEAVKRAVHEQPGVLIVGSELCKQSGTIVCRNLKESPETSSIRILMLHCGKSDTAQQKMDDLCEPDGYIQKPVEDSRLLEIISRLM